MDSVLKVKDKSKGLSSSLCVVGVFTLLTVVLYVFFRYAHPIVIWDGDDWHSNNWGTPYILHNVLDWKVGAQQFSNLLGNLVGTLFGYFAAFIIYPITGDYIKACMTADAFARAFFIALSISFFWKWLADIFQSNKLAWIGSAVFLVSAFEFLKTSDNSSYLYWSYNRCTLYLYCIPSFLGGSFFLDLVRIRLTNEPIPFSRKSAFLLVALYFVMFSHFPVAVMVAALAFAILIYDGIIKYKSIKHSISVNWFYCIALLLFVVKAILELLRTLSSGYLSVADSFVGPLGASLQVLLSSFSQMQSLFKALALLGVLFAIDSFLISSFKKTKNGDDYRWIQLVIVFFIAIIILFLFYLVFGASSIIHLTRGGNVRADTLYCLYFLIIVVISISWIYIIQKSRRVVVLLPLLLFMMMTVVISPNNSYGDSYFKDSTPEQKYEIMSAVVKAAQEKDRVGETSLVVHMPPFNHWCYGWIGSVLHWHDLTSSEMSIKFFYDAAIGEIWFE